MRPERGSGQDQRRAGAAAQAMPRGPIDLVHLGKQTLGDLGLRAEVLRLFDEMARVYWARAKASPGPKEMQMHFHALKGAASGIGAWGIADLARAAEHDVQSGAGVSTERLDDISLAVEEVSAYIAEVLGADAA